MHEIASLQIIIKSTGIIVLYSEGSQNGTRKFCTQATQRDLGDDIDGDDTQGFLLSVYCCIPFQTSYFLYTAVFPSRLLTFCILLYSPPDFLLSVYCCIPLQH
jgi:hypothetical protein